MDYLKIYNTLDSTNKEAHRLLAQGPVNEGLTLFTSHQTDGHGQLGRTWISAPGNHLAMTIIIHPREMRPSELPILGMKTSLGIVRALLELDPSLLPLIKWPNDIYVNRKKLCGILIENSLSGHKVQHSIIGIGMNINETEFPPEIPNAVSLLQLTSTSYDPQQVALLIRENVLHILNGDSIDWKAQYDQHIFGKGQYFEFISGENKSEAAVIGVSIEGHLQLKNLAGDIKAYASHEVRWVM